jgi:uncharacterized protein (DUF924 family)
MYQEILKFWFEEIKSLQWFTKDDSFDQLISDRFSDVHSRAVLCELHDWRKNAQGRLAEIIVLDQFSRNMFRESPLAFRNDPLALVLSQEAISLGMDKLLKPVERSFMYLPFMHSESSKIKEFSVKHKTQQGTEKKNLLEKKKKKNILIFWR